MLLGLVLAWIAGPQEAQKVVYDVPLSQLVLDGGAKLPVPDQAQPWMPWERMNAAEMLWPRAELEGPGEVFYTRPGFAGNYWEDQDHVGSGRIVARTDAPADLHGTLFFPSADYGGMERFGFSIPASRATSDEGPFLRAAAQHYGRLLRDGLPGSAWFRHRLAEVRERLGEAATSDESLAVWFPQGADDDLLGTYGLLSGGRALAENLQLERALPEAAAGEPTVELSKLEGITVREFDWASRRKGEPALDALAALVPADQHALFFPSFQALVDVVDETSELGVFALALFEERSSDARTRERYERQLCLELDGVARALGGLAVDAVAVTGSDPYLRSGSDVAILFATRRPDPLRAFVAARQDAAAGSERLEGEIGGVPYRGVANGTRSTSSYVASIGQALVVTNSLGALERIAAVAAKASPALAAAEEYRFFRERYVLGAAAESAFLMLPDAAIRRWCGPRWRIAASRRTRATAVLAELAAAHATELARGAVVPGPLAFDTRGFPMGELTLTPEGPRSSIYGTLDFVTPIAELGLERVNESEAALYRAWRDGYQANWSRFFDPIALSIAVAKERLAADLSVMPLIENTDYEELRTFVGKARLDPLDGDPHEGTIFHYAMALDPESPPVQDVGQVLSGVVAELADPMGWIGGSLSVYADADPFWDDLASADREAVFESFQRRLNEIPIVLHVEVASALKLAAFLSTVRGFVEGASPDLLVWHTAEEGPHRFVEVRARTGFVPDFSLYYATTSEALVVSFHRAALVRALDRLASRGADAAAKPPAPPAREWLGESLSVFLSREGLTVFEALAGDEWTSELRRRSWSNLPILNEWKRLFPDLDPVLVHRRVFGEHLRCPTGSEYVWDEAWRTMSSPVCGSPAAPPDDSGDSGTFALPAPWRALVEAGFGLTFEDAGLRARAEARRE
jgi:hypothetical protein